MDASFIKKLELLTNSKIEIANTKKENNSVNHQIFAAINLPDYNNKSLIKLNFSRRFDIYFEKTLNILFLIIATFVISLLFNFYYIRKLVYRPLSLITKVLLSGDRVATKKLRRTTGEFSYIGNLFEENNKQKRELINAKIKAEEGDRLKSS